MIKSFKNYQKIILLFGLNILINLTIVSSSISRSSSSVKSVIDLLYPKYQIFDKIHLPFIYILPLKSEYTSDQLSYQRDLQFISGGSHGQDIKFYLLLNTIYRNYYNKTTNNSNIADLYYFPTYLPNSFNQNDSYWSEIDRELYDIFLYSNISGLALDR